MGKTSAQRQKEYRERLKAKNQQGYLEKERKRKNKKLTLLKAADSQAEYMGFLKRDREKDTKHPIR